MRVLRALLLTCSSSACWAPRRTAPAARPRDRDERAAASDPRSRPRRRRARHDVDDRRRRADPDRPTPSGARAAGRRRSAAATAASRCASSSTGSTSSRGCPSHHRRVDDRDRAAVRGFQAKRGLKATGVVDAGTWQRLVRDDQAAHARPALQRASSPARRSSPPATRATTSATCRPGSSQIAWLFGDVTGTYDDATVEAVRGFQAKREIPVTGEVDQRTLDRLHAMTDDADRTRQLHNIGPTARARSTRAAGPAGCCASTRPASTLRWVVDGKVQPTLDVRFGVSTTPDPRGPVPGLLQERATTSRSLYDSSMPFAMFFSGGQAVHYSSDFAAGGLRRRLARLRQRARLRRRRLALRPGAGRRQGRRLLVLTDADVSVVAMRGPA